jgi:tRNA (cmo5U34)-methyltransferase
VNKTNKPHSVDTLFEHNNPELSPFSFNQSVVDVFPDMINRSVPGYRTIVEGIGKISRKVITEGATVFDLGCSLGSVSLSVAKFNAQTSFNIHAIDNSPAMVERCKHHVGAYKYAAQIDVKQGDINELHLNPCDLVVINFTLQFISIEQRQAIINKVYQALKPGGMLIVSEKVSANTKPLDELLIDLHHDFKRENGYSDLEISHKRSALENVMIIDSFDTHRQRMQNAGFEDLNIWFQHFNFLSMFAIK